MRKIQPRHPDLIRTKPASHVNTDSLGFPQVNLSDGRFLTKRVLFVYHDSPDKHMKSFATTLETVRKGEHMNIYMLETQSMGICLPPALKLETQCLDHYFIHLWSDGKRYTVRINVLSSDSIQISTEELWAIVKKNKEKPREGFAAEVWHLKEASKVKCCFAVEVFDESPMQMVGNDLANCSFRQETIEDPRP